MRGGSSVVVTSPVSSPEYSVTRSLVRYPPVRMKEDGDREMEQWYFLPCSRGKLSTPSPPSTGRSSVVEGE